MTSDDQTRDIAAKTQWINAFVEAFLHGQHYVCDKSLRTIAMQQWQAHQSLDPARVARQWSTAATRSP